MFKIFHYYPSLLKMVYSEDPNNSSELLLIFGNFLQLHGLIRVWTIINFTIFFTTELLFWTELLFYFWGWDIFLYILYLNHQRWFKKEEENIIDLNKYVNMFLFSLKILTKVIRIWNTPKYTYFFIVYQTELLLWYELLLIWKKLINWTIVSVWTIINFEKFYLLNYYLVRTIIRMLRVTKISYFKVLHLLFCWTSNNPKL